MIKKDKSVEMFLDEDKKEKIVFNNEGFVYEKKEKSSYFNSCVVRVTPSFISFYDKKSDKILHKSSYYLFKFYKDFSFLEYSSEDKDDSILKTDIITVNNNDIEGIEKIVRRYGLDGFLESVTSDFNSLNVSREEYIKELLVGNKDIKELFNYLFTYISDFDCYLLDINSDFKYLMDIYLNNKVYTK